MQAFLTGIVGAVGLGSVYALVALSFTLIVASTGYFHLGMGAFVTLGAVGAYTGVVTLGWSWWLTALLVIIAGALVGVLSEVVAVRPVRGRALNDHYAVMVATLAFMIVVDSLIELSFGSNQDPVPSYIAGPPFQLGDIPVRRLYIVMAVVLIAVAALLEVMMRRTGTGRILRAAQDDSVGVEILGVSFNRVVLISFAVAGGLAGLAGVLISPISYASAFVGTDQLIYGFAAMAIGGFGSFAGAVTGGYIVGLVVSISPLYLSPNFTDPLLLLVVLVILLLRPSGVLGRKEVRYV
jgi:branched-chain amino acid transport system permease protein